jgi:hypothetical protein
VENQDSPYYDLTLRPTAEDFETGEVVAPLNEIPAVPGGDYTGATEWASTEAHPLW